MALFRVGQQRGLISNNTNFVHFKRFLNTSLNEKIPPRGLINLDSLVDYAKEGKIETVTLGFPDHHGRFMGKRYEVDYFLKSGHKMSAACKYLLTVDIDSRVREGFKFTNWAGGNGDMELRADLSTLRICGWEKKTAVVISDVYHARTEKLVEVAPRSILRRQLKRAADLGYQALAATELEYYTFKDTYEAAHKSGYRSLKPEGHLNADYHLQQGFREEKFHSAFRRSLKDTGLDVETSKGETGHGQSEINISHDEALKTADHHVLLKQCLKDLAFEHQLAVTFMPRPNLDAPSGGHLHINLTRDGKNAFAGDKEWCGLRCSDEFRWFLGGLLKFTPPLLPFYAPTINSYKRFQSASWAPTNYSCSYDNRSTGFRVVGEGKNLRIECRIGGADNNPYLSLAAAFACGLEGIENKIEPSPLLSGDAYTTKDLPKVATTLKEARENFVKNEFVGKTLGQDVADHYAEHFRQEIFEYECAVTDWELKRYFEQA